MIQPYAQGKRWTLYEGDVLRVLPELREAGLQVDGVITDPPYSSGGQFRGDRATDPRQKYLQSGSPQAAYLPTFSGDNRDQRSLERWCMEWASDCLALSREGAVLACSIDWRGVGSLLDALQGGGWVLRGLAPWIKPDARPQLGRLTQAAEFVIWGSAGGLDDRQRAVLGAVPGYLLSVAPRNREHVTQKPNSWGDWLCKLVTGGGTVLDPFAGSGVVGEAALRSGRCFVGCEIQAEYLRIAARRLAQAELDGQPQPLFVAGAP